MGSVQTPRALRIGALRAAAGALTSPATLRAALRFVGTVARDFFWLQFSVKLGIRKIKIINVDHELDARIPFRPEKIGAYLDFIAFWIRPIGQIRKHCGRAAERRHAVAFLDLLTTCYRQASEVYRATMTTTRRPRYLRGRFLAIHLFDPHLLCVPSLHIMIVVATYTYYRRAFAELGLTPDAATALDGELFAEAVEIAESVLYIKQHSVNCLPAALYAISQLTPAEVTAAEVDRFIETLFTSPDETLPGTDAAAIRAQIASTFEDLGREGRDDPDWMTTVRGFIAGLA